MTRNKLTKTQRRRLTGQIWVKRLPQGRYSVVYANKHGCKLKSDPLCSSQRWIRSDRLRLYYLRNKRRS